MAQDGLTIWPPNWRQDEADNNGLALRGQSLVYDAWRSRLHGRNFILRNDLDLSALACELAHISVLARDADGFRFRLAGSALRNAFEVEPRGRAVSELAGCSGARAWDDGPAIALERQQPVIGRSSASQDMVHFWMRLPMSSAGDGEIAAPDLVLCHDRVLPGDRLSDPDQAAFEADRAMRLDAFETAAA